VKCHLSERLRQVRVELFGERGGSEMARRLGLPIRTWYNYEGGVTVPAEVLLRFMELTAVEPLWLLHGRGPKFRDLPPPSLEPDSVEALLRTALHRLERRETEDPSSETVSTRLPLRRPLRSISVIPTEEPAVASPVNGQVTLLAAEGTGLNPVTESAGARYVAARREWLAAQRERRTVLVEGDAMAPVLEEGSTVAYTDRDNVPAELDGKLVVAWVEGHPLVRWFQSSGRYALLRSENPNAPQGTIILDLQGPDEGRRIRRVIGISSPF
jgi:phage repressor protein C with HTH and peptisase S24 domain